MVVPLVAAMAATAAISAGMAAAQSRAANKANTNIAQANLNAEESARRSAAFEAQRQQRDARLGSTDAAGNITRFIPGVGWTTDLSPDQEAIQQGSEEELLRQLLEEAGRNERVSSRANVRRNREDTLSTEAEREFRATRRPDEGQLRQLFLARGAEQRNRSADRAGEQVARQNIRAGGANAAELLQSARAASDASASRQAGVDATLLARQTADDDFNMDRDRVGQLYDYFRRASTSGTQSPSGYMPTGPAQQRSGVADQALINVLARAPQAPYKQPDFSLSDTIAGLGNAAGSYYGMTQNAKFQDALMDRWGKNTSSGGKGF